MTRGKNREPTASAHRSARRGPRTSKTEVLRHAESVKSIRVMLVVKISRDETPPLSRVTKTSSSIRSQTGKRSRRLTQFSDSVTAMRVTTAHPINNSRGATRPRSNVKDRRQLKDRLSQRKREVAARALETMTTTTSAMRRLLSLAACGCPNA